MAPIGKRQQVLKRGKNKVPIHDGEKKKSRTGAPIKHKRAKPPEQGGRLGVPQLISYEKDSDGGATVRVGRGVVALLEGTDDVAEWTDAELLQGYRDGQRRPPNMIPTAVYHELANRVMSRARFYYIAELEVAMQKHFEIVKNINAADKDHRVTMVEWLAIKEIYERVLGQAEQKVTIGLDTESWKQVIANAIVPSEEGIIDVEPVDGDDDDPVDAAL